MNRHPKGSPEYLARLLALASPSLLIVAGVAFFGDPKDWTMVWFGAGGAAYLTALAWWFYRRRDAK